MTSSGVFETVTRVPEAELMMLCLHRSAEHDARILQLLESPLQWELFFQYAQRHGIIPLLHRKLSQVGLDHVPASARAKLENAYRVNLTRNMAAASELIEILRLCQRDAIDVLPFKGLVLAQQLYGDIGMRVFCDIDFLVPPQQVAPLRAVLAERGYQAKLGLNPQSDETLLKAWQQIPFFHPTRPTLVEIHSALLTGRDASATNFDAVHRNIERIEIAGEPLDAVPIEQMLLYLCVHGAKHCWERLSWICDIARLIELKPDLEWESVWSQAEALGWERPLLLGVALSRDLLGAVLPPAIDQRTSCVEPLVRDVTEQLLLARRDDISSWWRLRFHLRSTDRWQARARFLWDVTVRPTEADWESVTLPRSLSLLYYPIRLLRLTAKYAGRLLPRAATRPSRS